MIVLIGGEKGGTGKSTVAINLAVELVLKGEDVLLLDCDSQKTTSSWGWLRNQDPELPALSVLDKTSQVDREIEKIAPKFDHVIVDAGGRDSIELRSALLVADVFYSPVQPSFMDLATISTTAMITKTAKKLNPDLRAKFFFNRAATNPKVNDTQDAADFIREQEFEGIGLSDLLIRERASFRNAVAEGKGVSELSGKKADEKAVVEVKQLFEEIFNGQ
jgi:chromosome partitioning protein